MTAEIKNNLALKLKRQLDGLDAKVLFWFKRLKYKLQNLDQRSSQQFQQTKSRLTHLDRVVWQGGSKQIVKKRTGNWLFDKFSGWWYDFCRFLDWLDTKIYFRGRRYQALECRVRSKAEKQIANYFTEHHIRFKYEKELRFGRVILHPDFYLSDYDVWLEYWGLADSNPKYEENYRQKLRLYCKYGIKIISIYPRHLRNFESVFPRLFQEVTGKSLPF